MAALGFFWPAATTGDTGDDAGFATLLIAGGADAVLIDVSLESGGTLLAAVALLDASRTLVRDEAEFLAFGFDFPAAWCATALDPGFRPGFESALIVVFDPDFTPAFNFVSACFVAAAGVAG
jgi:hypothetical protein